MEAPWFFFLFSISLVSCAIAQDRSPHGLENQKPVALSPSAYEFFHPNDRQDPCTRSHCSPLPLAAQLHETQSQGGQPGGSTMKTHVRVMGAGAIATPAFAALIILCMAMGIYYLVRRTRPAKSSLTKTLAPDV